MKKVNSREFIKGLREQISALEKEQEKLMGIALKSIEDKDISPLFRMGVNLRVIEIGHYIKVLKGTLKETQETGIKQEEDN